MAKPNLTDVYEALRVAEAEGRTDDVKKLIDYIDSVVAAPDIETEESYDPRDLVDKTMPAIAGAGTGIVAPAILKSAAEQTKAAKVARNAPKPTVTVSGVPSSALADIEEATTKGLSNEITQQTRTAQRAARTEQMEKILAELKAKGLPVNPKILAEMEAQYARPGSGILIPVETAKKIATEEAALPKAAQKAPLRQQIISQWKNPGSVNSAFADIGNFAKGVYDYKLPFVGSLGSLAGRGLVGAGAGMQGADAYNRYKMGDTTGAVISGLGSLGTASTLAPHPAIKAIGTGVGLSAEAINAYRDAMRRGQIEHGAPENYENVDAMGNAFAQGGLVHLAGGGSDVPPWKRSVIPNPEDEQGMFSYAPGYYAEVADNIVPEGKTAGPNDAARHMLAAADLTRRIGTVPLVGKHIAGPLVKGLGYGHELANYIQNIGGGKPQTKEDMEQDLHNNALGIDLGRNAGSFQDIVNKIPNAVNVRPYRKEAGKAYIRNPQEVGTPYKPFGAFADGGQVQHYQAGRIVKAAKDLILPAAENAARTQIIGTLPTYGKAADIFAQRGATGQALDFGAGLGKGADLLGPGTHTYEPFAQGWNPTYTNAKDIPSDAYGRLTNLNVLNVVPRDVRDEMVLDIGRTMEPGGSGIITTRGADVMKAKGTPGPEPMSIITSRDTYQKGFTKQELEDYLRYMLGKGYDINKLNLGPAGAYIQKKADGGLVHLAEGSTPPKSDANEGKAFIGYPHINKNRKIGSGTGFLDALVGAPPSRENILNPSDLSYMQGYEKGEPYGIAGMVAPFLGGAVNPLAKEIGKRAFMGESLSPRMLRGLVPEAPAMGIIKNEKGGNWMPDAMMDYNGWTPEQQLAETLGFSKNDPALENWVNKQLTRYVKNEMGTPGDPVRALADKGVLHYKPRPSRNEAGQNNNVYYHAEDKREMAGMPEGESALTQLGRDWENNVDLSVNTNTIDDKMIEEYGGSVPWLEKSKGQKLNSIDKEFMYSDLGFDHIVDVLREQIAAGQLRPESLKSLSVPQAVQRTYEYNLAKERAMQKVALENEKAMPIHKEYEGGYKWLDLTSPKTLPSGQKVVKDEMTGGYKVVDESGKDAVQRPTNNLGHTNVPFHKTEQDAINEALQYDKRLEKALKYEGDTMGHCVGGYCPDVQAGKTKIYSLRDAKGEPHVTVEVNPGNRHHLGFEYAQGADSNAQFPKDFYYTDREGIRQALPPQQHAAIYSRAKELFQQNPGKVMDSLQQAADEVLGAPPPSIVQIKGKQNQAPKAEYQPFVQDFVRSGNWSEVRDVHNTGLKDMSLWGSNWELKNLPEDLANTTNMQRYNALKRASESQTFPKYATEEEVADIIRKNINVGGLDNLE